jgi:hypothetical protein
MGVHRTMRHTLSTGALAGHTNNVGRQADIDHIVATVSSFSADRPNPRKTYGIQPWRKSTGPYFVLRSPFGFFVMADPHHVSHCIALSPS